MPERPGRLLYDGDDDHDGGPYDPDRGASVHKVADVGSFNTVNPDKAGTSAILEGREGCPALSGTPPRCRPSAGSWVAAHPTMPAAPAPARAPAPVSCARSRGVESPGRRRDLWCGLVATALEIASMRALTDSQLARLAISATRVHLGRRRQWLKDVCYLSAFWGKPKTYARSEPYRFLPRRSFGSIHRTCPIGVTHRPPMKAWYHPSIACMTPNRRVTWQATSNDENS